MFKRHGFPRRLFHRLQLPPGDVAVLTAAMRGARFSLVAGLVAIAALLAGCSSEPPTTPAAPAPTGTLSASPTAAATEPPDEYAIPDDPDDIDEEYVERVLEALSNGYVEATREVVAQKAVTERVREILRETHTSEARRSAIEDFRTVLMDDPTGRPLSPNPKPAVIEVQEVIEANHDCIYTLVKQDLSGFVRGGAEPFVSYYFLTARSAAATELNPTPWLIAGSAEPLPDGEEYANPCDPDT